MKIAIAAGRNDIMSNVDPHFGRCTWFCIFDSESKIHEFIENTTRSVTENAGNNAVEFLSGKNVQVVVAGRFGSKVVEALRTRNIQMIIPDKERKINEIINQIR